ncbi:MAG: flagellar hook capping FlgD N-terminal domain-containing protein [Ilumatobacter sp.]
MDAIAPIGTLDPTAQANVDANPVGAPPPNSTLDKDAFLKLLIAQLKYQDPTAPTDVSEMMAQTSSLSMVERLDEIAEGINAMNSGGPITNAAGMLGKEVTFEAGQPEPITATVDSVRIVDGQTLLSAGGYDVPLDALVEVRPATAPVVPTLPITTSTTASDEPAASDGNDQTNDTSATTADV